MQLSRLQLDLYCNQASGKAVWPANMPTLMLFILCASTQSCVLEPDSSLRHAGGGKLWARQYQYLLQPVPI